MLAWGLDLASRQSREEVQRQFGVMDRLEAHRRPLSLIPFLVAAIWMPLWACMVLMVLCTWLEAVGFNAMRRVQTPESNKDYLFSMACFAAAQIVYMMVPALVWQDPDSIAKAFAVGVYMINLTHLATARTVHFPLAVVTIVPATLVSLTANGWFWLGQGNWIGLAISTICVLAVSYFVLITMQTIHELHNEMYRDKQAAEAANEAKSRFLAQMSHELRTPLNAILGMGFAEMALATTPETKERFGTLVQSARGLSILLNDILDMSAVQAGQLPIRPVVVDIRVEAGAALDLFRQQMVDAGLHISLSIDDAVPAFVRIDGQRFRQCLTNLLSNAVKYASVGEITIAIHLPEPGIITVDVADTGPGIPETLRETIFEPFQRGDSLAMGTGLGLSISRTLARRMGGDLVLLPSEKGATFKLSFALAPAAEGEVVAEQTNTLVDLSGKHFLVVDDIATNRLVAMTYLRIMGATSTEASGGQAALDYLRTETPDAVLLDMVMPDMDGLTTFARIRGMTRRVGQVPVIAMTADAADDHRRGYLEAGLDGYVSKPLTPEALGAAIRAVLSRGTAENDMSRRN